ncbi:hypothetical protein SAMN04488005_3093 [Yoonia tamlensis]|uniref:Uncharacterized protein n=1 Tax=Yoonia tamlensis TaxID=390270 RepID=A0A1I6HXL3_9RHOB|nr:hypothetical protein [Yoonia tamlensis]SFR59167.1 hypothetical protein SAMN04488005_3093 [Yoonia tamlensis]
MTVPSANPGGAAVGQLSEQPPLTRYVAMYFRMWCDGPEGQTAVWQDLAAGLGERHGRTAMENLETLFDLCARYRRRPLMRHAVGCKCLGADEACFSHFVTTAAEGDNQDAMLIATLIVRADIAPLITPLAADFGRALKRMILQQMPPSRAYSQAIPATIH